MASACFALQVNGSAHKLSISHNFEHLKTSFSDTLKKPFLKELQKISLRVDISKTITNTSRRKLDAFVDSVFHFVDQPVFPSQKNFAPVDEIGEAVEVFCSEGRIPQDFPEGIYIRNGPNPLFGGLKSAFSIFGRSSHIWVEGEGMLHALYFMKDDDGDWALSYKNRYVEPETFKLDKQRNRPSFLPTVQGDSLAMLAAFLLNLLRFGMVSKKFSNTNIIEHSGKFYAVSENHLPQEIDIFTLETLEEWDLNGAWNRPFTSHPKKAPGTGELVIMGIDAKKPFVVAGVVSADGNELSHKVDLKFKRAAFLHEIAVTQRYIVIMDYPLTIEISRLIRGDRLIKYDKEDYARIGVMPRYGDADSVQWFKVESHCTFHIINSFEHGDEVVIRGCRALDSIIPGPDHGLNKPNENSSSLAKDEDLFTRAYEWRLNIETGEVKEKNLTGMDFCMDFPMINEDYTGVKHKYGYAHVVDSMASSICGLPKFGGVAKLFFEEQDSMPSTGEGKNGQRIKVEYHSFGENSFCTGSAFVSKAGSEHEDDGWIVSFVHNENTDVSQVHIIDASKFNGEPIVKITLPRRVPYGFHGTFIPTPNPASKYIIVA